MKFRDLRHGAKGECLRAAIAVKVLPGKVLQVLRSSMRSSTKYYGDTNSIPSLPDPTLRPETAPTSRARGLRGIGAQRGLGAAARIVGDRTRTNRLPSLFQTFSSGKSKFALSWSPWMRSTSAMGRQWPAPSDAKFRRGVCSAK